MTRPTLPKPDDMLRLLRIEIDDLSIHWPRRTVLRHWSHQLDLSDAEQRLPIVGVTGCGKSSLLYVLAGLKAPSGGAVTWVFATDDGEHALRIRAADGPGRRARVARYLRRHCFGFVFQDARLLPYLTLHENIAMGNRTQRHQDDDWNQRVETMLQGLFRPDERDPPPMADDGGSAKPRPRAAKAEQDRPVQEKFPNEVSGGQGHRAAVAQILMNRPRVLCADEPTGSLDPMTRKLLLKQVFDWQQRHGSAFIWVTHHRHRLIKHASHALYFPAAGAHPQRIAVADLPDDELPEDEG